MNERTNEYILEKPPDKKGHKTIYTCPHTVEHIHR